MYIFSNCYIIYLNLLQNVLCFAIVMLLFMGSLSRTLKHPSIACISLFPLDSSAYVKKNSKNIWDEDEVTEGAHFDDLSDPRPQPE